MSQPDPADTDPSAETPRPPAQPPQNEASSCEDVQTVPPPPSGLLQLPVGFDTPQSSEEMTTEDAMKKRTPEAPADHPEPASEAHVTECDQQVSLEPDKGAAEEEGEVNSSFGYCLGTSNVTSSHFEPDKSTWQ